MQRQLWLSCGSVILIGGFSLRRGRSHKMLEPNWWLRPLRLVLWGLRQRVGSERSPFCCINWKLNFLEVGPSSTFRWTPRRPSFESRPPFVIVEPRRSIGSPPKFGLAVGMDVWANFGDRPMAWLACSRLKRTGLPAVVSRLNLWATPASVGPYTRSQLQDFLKPSTRLRCFQDLEGRRFETTCP